MFQFLGCFCPICPSTSTITSSNPLNDSTCIRVDVTRFHPLPPESSRHHTHRCALKGPLSPGYPQTVFPITSTAGGGSGSGGGEGNNDAHHWLGEDAPFQWSDRRGTVRARIMKTSARFFSFLSSLSVCLSRALFVFPSHAVHSQNGYVKPATMEGLADISLDAVR